MRIADTATSERHEGFQVLEQRFLNVSHSTDSTRASPTRKALPDHLRKIACNKIAARAFAWMNENTTNSIQLPGANER